MHNIEKIISEYFTAEQINDIEKIMSSNVITKAIDDFTNYTRDWKEKSSLFQKLRAVFGDKFKIQDNTHFFYNDRCLDVSFTGHNCGHCGYNFRVSIFHYFHATRINEEFFERDKDSMEPNWLECDIFVQQDENEICNQAFEIIRGYYPRLIWLSPPLLKTSVQSLNIINGITNARTNIGDLLFKEII